MYVCAYLSLAHVHEHPMVVCMCVHTLALPMYMYILWLQYVCTYLSLAHVHVHPIVAHGNHLQVEVSHAVDLELEGECRLQVPVDPVLYEL